MGAQGQGVDRGLYGSPALTALQGHPLAVVARRDWPLDHQVHLLACEVAATAEATLRGARRQVTRAPGAAWAATVLHAIGTVRQAQRYFPGPEVARWATEAERALLDCAVARLGVERVLVHLAEGATVAQR